MNGQRKSSNRFDEANDPSPLRIQSVCRDTLPWLISFLLGVMCTLRVATVVLLCAVSQDALALEPPPPTPAQLREWGSDEPQAFVSLNSWSGGTPNGP